VQGSEVVNLPGVTGLKSSVIPQTSTANLRYSSKKSFLVGCNQYFHVWQTNNALTYPTTIDPACKCHSFLQRLGASLDHTFQRSIVCVCICIYCKGWACCYIPNSWIKNTS
jgi:hypothetical protein